ncbi:MAG: hypothetical protein JNK75_10890 [Betaproteobacteria bacterium]|nr:hypothetical protein [Betaproteobacteria bacterium]
MALAILIGGALVVINGIDGNASRVARDARTENVLNQAKQALIAYASGRDISPTQTAVGTLPCPDLDDDGAAETSCGNASGSTSQSNRLGRLPWRTLGIADLRDASGERLWYAVSSMYKTSTVNGFNPTTGLGTITVRDAAGTVFQDGTLSNPYTAGTGGAVAVIFAPGDALVRQGGSTLQDRSCSGGSCGSQGECTSSPASLTAKCNPVNYLDVAMGEDNSNFVDNNVTRTANGNGFISGPVFSGNSVILNDRIAVVGYEDIMPALQRRVAREVLKCLTSYAATYRNRYPWPAPTCRQASSINSWSDHDSVLFGRVPDTGSGTFDTTVSTSGSTMGDTFTGDCMFESLTGWWPNWKRHVFYAVADAHKPAASAAGNGGPCSGDSNCLRIADSSGNILASNKQVAVIVTGRALNGVSPAQVRSGNNDGYASNYIEGNNVTLEQMIVGTIPAACNALSPAVVTTGCSPLSNCNRVTTGNRSPSFNDVVVYSP